MHVVYIIYSASRGIYYKGYTTNAEKRLEQHNKNESRYTANKGPWSLVYIEVYQSKREALIREKSIKKYSKAQLLQLINR
jgi:putative endonuclease